MFYFQRLCFCDYRWLWILSIITITTIGTKAEQNSLFDSLNKTIVDNIEEVNNNFKNQNSISNLIQKTFSRPSNILKQLWSSASKSSNISDDNNNQTNGSNNSFSAKFLFGPSKWSSDIVPSIPLSFQLSSNAINLSPHLKEETNGDITVINGFSPHISYPPKDYKVVNRSQQNFYEINDFNSVLTPSSLIMSTIRAPTDISSAFETIRSEVSVPLVNDTTVPIINETIPTKIITTTATIVSTTEADKRTGELLSAPYVTTFRSVQTTHGLTQSPKMSATDLRRKAIQQRFGKTYHSYGSRLTRTPPRVSIDSFLSVYKPNLKNQFLKETLKTGLNTSSDKLQKTQKNTTENPVQKPKLIQINKTNDIPIKTNPRRDQFMTAESRNALSSILLFPSRPAPFLKPRISNTTKVCRFLCKSPKNSSQTIINSKNVKNVKTNAQNDRTDDNQLIESIVKNRIFGYRKNVFESNINDKSESNNNKQNNITSTIEPIDSLSTDGVQMESVIDPHFESEQLPIVVAEDHYFIPMDDLADSHKHYINKMKQQEQNIKNLPNPALFKDELNDPSRRKVEPTIPNKVMQFEEMMRHLALVMQSINKLTPLGRVLTDQYKQFTHKFRLGQANKKKGTYAKYYPPGTYDDIYEPDPVVENNRRHDEEMAGTELNESYDRTPDNYTLGDSTDRLGDINNSYIHNDYDDEGLIKKSFGYRVTVFRTPEKDESNVTEEALDDTNDLNSNKSDDLSVSESSDEYSVTTDSNNGTEYLMTAASNHLRGESQSGLKGNAKGMDYKRNKYNRQRGSHAREELSANKSKKVDTHDRRANNERALKERTVIEFFEREHIMDTAYNKDKLGIDKTDSQKYDEDQHVSGSMTSSISATDEPLRQNGTVISGDVHQFADTQRNHVTNAQTFDTIFPEHDRKYKHKDNAHKYKGWKERGYKIITETEFVDRGLKVDSGYKRHVNGSKGHIKEHSAGDVTKADQKKYNKNVKNINKNYEALYGQRMRSPQKNNENRSKVKVLMNADDYHKYYHNNGLNSGETQHNEQTQQTPNDSTEQTLDKTLTSSEGTTGTVGTVRTTTIGDTIQDYPIPDVFTRETHPATEPGVTVKSVTEQKPQTLTSEDNTLTTDRFQAPPIDTDNYWRPIITTSDQPRNTDNYYVKQKHYNTINYNYDNDYNNVYPTVNTNVNYFPNFENDVNNNIEISKGFPTITAENFGAGSNPYSMPLVSEEVHSYSKPNGPDINPEVPQYFNDQQYYYQPIPNSVVKSQDFSIDNKNKNKFRHQNNSSTQSHTQHKNSYDPNDTYLKPHYDILRKPQLTPNYPPLVELQPTPDVPMGTDQPYYDYQVYPSVDTNLDSIPRDRPLFGLIGDETKNVYKTINKLKHNIKAVPKQQNNSPNNNQLNTGIHKQKAQNMESLRYFKQTVASPEVKDNYVRPVKINTRLPRPGPEPVPKSLQKVRAKTFRKKKPKKPKLFPTRPLMAPPIDGLYLNSNQIQNLLNPMANYPFQFKFPMHIRGTPQTPSQLSYDSNYAESDNRPIAILHPNKMLTITTTNLLNNKMNDHFWTSKVVNPFRQSTPLHLSLIPQKFRQERRSFKELFPLKNWFKSRFQS